jgi:hypothetical protein
VINYYVHGMAIEIVAKLFKQFKEIMTNLENIDMKIS